MRGTGDIHYLHRYYFPETHVKRASSVLADSSSAKLPSNPLQLTGDGILM
ncbi:MAG: hypothetical protein RLP44_24005 [Aggregatilineales bacterium]